jgi:hypothetical protein
LSRVTRPRSPAHRFSLQGCSQFGVRGFQLERGGEVAAAVGVVQSGCYRRNATLRWCTHPAGLARSEMVNPPGTRVSQVCQVIAQRHFRTASQHHRLPFIVHTQRRLQQPIELLGHQGIRPADFLDRRGPQSILFSRLLQVRQLGFQLEDLLITLGDRAFRVLP